jgi:hypothetical protein
MAVAAADRPVAGAAPSNTAARRAVAAAAAPAAAEAAPLTTSFSKSRDEYFTLRHQIVRSHFPSALGVEDFTARLERALSAFGFNGENAIGEPARRPLGLPDTPLAPGGSLREMRRATSAKPAEGGAVGTAHR